MYLKCQFDVPYFRYFLYTKTPIGKLYYGRELRKARQLYQKNGHSVCEPTTHNGKQHIDFLLSNFIFINR